MVKITHLPLNATRVDILSSIRISLQPEMQLKFHMIFLLINWQYVTSLVLGRFYSKACINDMLRLLFVLVTEHTVLHMFSNIWHQILFLGDLHDAAL